MKLIDSPGYRLRLLRKKLEKTQSVFADELGVSGSTLSRYEKNMRGPDTYFFRLLREKTKVDLNWLLTGDGEMFQSFPQDLINKQCPVKAIITYTDEIQKLLHGIEAENGSLD